MPNEKIETRSRKGNRMPNSLENNDLCLTCNYGPTCVRRKHHGKPVWYCEEFDDFQPAPAIAVIRKSAAKREEKSADGNKARGASMGLCIDCENNRDCAIPKADSGIWHCEEYR